MKRWINVNDEVPAYGEVVLACDSQQIYICYRPIEDEYNEHWEVCESACCACNGCTGTITHWMPLPEMPFVL